MDGSGGGDQLVRTKRTVLRPGISPQPWHSERGRLWTLVHSRPRSIPDASRGR